MDTLYLLLMAVGLGAVYVFLFFSLNLFFEKPIKKLSVLNLFSFLLIIFLSIFVSLTTDYIENSELANRLLHAIGGGFVGFFAYFLAVKDSGLVLSRWRLVVVGLLIVTALGVLNELAELVLQYFGILIAAESIFDTWFDLLSNAIGMLLAAIIVFPFYKKNLD